MNKILMLMALSFFLSRPFADVSFTEASAYVKKHVLSQERPHMHASHIYGAKR